ncbi:MAG: hypothetical protein GC154_14955 [bacterium]|nr:hypothetical protein [bacterium]
MNLRRLNHTFLAALLLIVAAGYFAAAQDGAPATPAQDGNGPEFDEFRVIIERNIFNPNRRGPQVEREPEPEPPPVQVDEYVLLGTLLTDQTAYAFIEGRGAVGDDVMSVGDALADGVIREIQASSIVVAASESAETLAVGEALSRRDGGPWAKTAPSAGGGSSRSGRFSRSSRTNASQTQAEAPKEETKSGSEAANAADSGSDANEILKRMMERRKQELSK